MASKICLVQFCILLCICLTISSPWKRAISTTHSVFAQATLKSNNLPISLLNANQNRRRTHERLLCSLRTELLQFLRNRRKDHSHVEDNCCRSCHQLQTINIHSRHLSNGLRSQCTRSLLISRIWNYSLTIKVDINVTSRIIWKSELIKTSERSGQALAVTCHYKPVFDTSECQAKIVCKHNDQNDLYTPLTAIIVSKLYSDLFSYMFSGHISAHSLNACLICQQSKTSNSWLHKFENIKHTQLKCAVFRVDFSNLTKYGNVSPSHEYILPFSSDLHPRDHAQCCDLASYISGYVNYSYMYKTTVVIKGNDKWRQAWKIKQMEEVQFYPRNDLEIPCKVVHKYNTNNDISNCQRIKKGLSKSIICPMKSSKLRLLQDGQSIRETMMNKYKRSIGSTHLNDVIPVNMAVLLPMTQDRLFCKERVFAAIQIAMNKVKEQLLIQSVQLQVRYADSHCSISDAMNAAIEFYARRTVNVFLGPICDYAVAPIARQIRYWKLPLITPGAMAGDFGFRKKSMFPLLTRMGSNFNSLLELLLMLLKHFQWHRMKLIYMPDGFENIMDRYCHIAADAIVLGTRMSGTNVTVDHKSFHEIQQVLYGLAAEIGTTWGGGDICFGAIIVRDILIGNITAGEIMVGDIVAVNIMVVNIIVGDFMVVNIIVGDFMVLDNIIVMSVVVDIMVVDIMVGDIEIVNIIVSDMFVGIVVVNIMFRSALKHYM